MPAPAVPAEALAAGERMEVVDRPRAAAERVGAADRLGQVRLRSPGCLQRAGAEGEAGRDRGRERAPGAVGVAGVDARRAQLLEAAAVEEDVHGVALEVAALDEDRARSERVQVA